LDVKEVNGFVSYGYDTLVVNGLTIKVNNLGVEGERY
jgi:hypothetical protein